VSLQVRVGFGEALVAHFEVRGSLLEVLVARLEFFGS